MSNGNNITLVGNITRDPELRFTASGQAVAKFGLAVNRKWQNRQTQEWEEQTSFFNVVCWGELGENAAESIAKGTRVIVSGRMDQRTYETEQGEKRNVVEVIADEIAPSLRWATAKVAKTERRDGAGAGGGGGVRPAGGSSGGGGGEDGAAAEEEPF